MTPKPRKRRGEPGVHTPQPARSPAPPVTALVIACVVFVVGAAVVMPFMPDDAFISFRYAEHLADGHGLAFNVGEAPVEAYSNFLWIILCAGLYRAGLSLPSVTPYAGVVLGLLSLAVFWTLCRRRAPLWTQQLLPCLAFASFGPFVLYAVSGMEMALFALLLLLVVRFGEDYVEAPGMRPLALLTATGFLASLARPEGLVAFPVLLSMLVWGRHRDGTLRLYARHFGAAAVAFGLATVVYHAWRVSYFGEWLPTPFLSKGAEGASLVFGWTKNLHRYFLNWAYFSPPQGYLFACLIGLSLAGLLSARAARVRASGDWMAFSLGLALCAVYANFVDWMPGMRYHAPLVGALLVPTRHLHRLVPEAVWRDAPGSRRGWLGTAALVLVLAAGVNLSHLRHATVKMEESARGCYVPLARWLRATMPSGSLLAMGDVGMVPYYSGLRTLDIHPESLTDSHIAKRAFTADYVLARAPDVVALTVRGVYSARMDPLHWSLYQHPAFQLEYAFVGTVRNQWHEDRAYWIFMRKEVNASDQQLAALPAGIGKQRHTRFDP